MSVWLSVPAEAMADKMQKTLSSQVCQNMKSLSFPGLGIFKKLSDEHADTSKGVIHTNTTFFCCKVFIALPVLFVLRITFFQFFQPSSIFELSETGVSLFISFKDISILLVFTLWNTNTLCSRPVRTLADNIFLQ